MRERLLVTAFCALTLAGVIYWVAPEYIDFSPSGRITIALLGGLVGALVAYAAYSQRRSL